MKHTLYLIAMLLMAFSCSNEEMEREEVTGKARLQFQVAAESPVLITRATPVPTVDKLFVKISKDGKTEKSDSLFRLQQSTPLYLDAEETGTRYTVEVYSHEKKDAVLDQPCYYASEEYTLFPDEITRVELTCTLQQFQISFKPTDSFMSAFKPDSKVADGEQKFKLTVSDMKGNSVSGYTYENLDKSAYFANSSPSVKLRIQGTTIKGFPVDYTETITKKDGTALDVKDHLIITLDVQAGSEMKSVLLNATTVEP